MKKKKTVTLPRTFNPGNGHPKETLAYLSPAEHELIRKLTDGKWNRGPKGVKSYADDSSSSNGVSRGDSYGTKGNAGVGQGGQRGGGNSGSKAGSSPSGGVSTGGGLRGAGSNTGPGSGRPGSGDSAAAKSSSSGAGGQRGAGSNYGPGSGRPGSSALGGAAKAAQNNASRGQVSNPVSMSGALDRGYYHSFSNNLPGMNNPTQFDKTIRPSNMVNAAHVPFDNWARNSRGKQFNPNELTAQTQKQYQAIVDTALRTGQPVSFFSGKDPRSSGTKNHPSGQAMDLRLNDPVTGLPVAGVTNPIRQEKLIGKPYTQFARDVFDTVYQNPDAYSGLRGGMRWGGNFGDVAKDWMHFDTRPSAGLSGMAQNFAREAENRAANGGFTGGTAFAGLPGGGYNSPVSGPLAGGTQLAGLANVGVPDAIKQQRAADALRALQQNAQAPQAPQGIPAPNSMGVFGSQYSGYGAFDAPAQRAAEPKEPANPVGGMSFTPGLPGQMPQAPQVTTDPRVALTPLGTLPAAKPPRDVQLAWNVPPMGGALIPGVASPFGVWGTNRPVQDPNRGANPGTIHSQTADAVPAAPAAANTTGWSWDSLRQTASTKMAEAQKQIDEVKQTAGWKFAQEHPKLAAFGLKMMMGGGGKPNGAMGSPQDRADFHMPPPMPFQPQQMAQADQPEATPLQTLQGLLNNMIAKGASPDEIAYVQSLIEELSKRQVA